jgi:hypothetical protein
VVYGPRDEHKLEIVEELLLASHGHVLKVSA